MPAMKLIACAPTSFSPFLAYLPILSASKTRAIRNWPRKRSSQFDT